MSQVLADLLYQLQRINSDRVQPPQKERETEGEYIGPVPEDARSIWGLMKETADRSNELEKAFFLGCQAANPGKHHCPGCTPPPPQLKIKLDLLDNRFMILKTLFWEEIYAAFPEELADRPGVYINQCWDVRKKVEPDEEDDSPEDKEPETDSEKVDDKNTDDSSEKNEESPTPEETPQETPQEAAAENPPDEAGKSDTRKIERPEDLNPAG